MARRDEANDGPVLLSGGNPQIPKGDGDEPVQAYIAAMPDWKRPIGERLDALISSALPGVHKAVKWNQPWYGPGGRAWWLSFRCSTEYVQLQFLTGTALEPMPPKSSKHEGMRYLDIREDDALDERQLRSWFEQTGALPGQPLG